MRWLLRVAWEIPPKAQTLYGDLADAFADFGIPKMVTDAIELILYLTATEKPPSKVSQKATTFEISEGCQACC